MSFLLATFWPVSASEHAEKVDRLFLCLLAVSGAIILMLLVFIVFTLFRYREDTEVDRTPMRLSPQKLEIFWTVVPAIIFLGLFAWGADLYLENEVGDGEPEEIYVVGRQWMWEMSYPDGHREHNRLVVPLDKTVRLTMASEDVIHSLYLPALRIKQDVVPGRYVTLIFKANRAGTYPLRCAEYCGTKHSGMVGTLTVLPPDEYQEWLSRSGDLPSLAVEGRRLFAEKGCGGCHMPGGSVRAPLLNGLFGKTIPLQDGSFVRADEQYIHDSILRPLKQITAGYEPLMPTFEGQLSEIEVISLVEYIKSLAETPIDTAPNPRPQPEL